MDVYPKLRTYLEELSRQSDRVGEPHRAAAIQLANWLVKTYRPGEAIGVIAVCTGNSRRSILTASLGNAAAAHAGLNDLRFFSGGTEPSAFNIRTVKCLREVGFDIEPTGDKAPGKDNPIYRVRWGRNGSDCLEFSKKYDDAANPKANFAAVMVCDDADAKCPTVRGATARVSMPYADPKAFDGQPVETAKYAERRDDIGRAMMLVCTTAAKRLRETGTIR